MTPSWGDNEPKKWEKLTERSGSSSQVALISGLVLAGLGIFGLTYVHSMHPPNGLRGTLGMLAAGRSNYIKEPAYAVLMALSFVAVLVGATMVVRAILNRGR